MLRLKNHAAGALPLIEGQQRSAGSGLEDVVDTLASKRRALEIFTGSHLGTGLVAFFSGDEFQGLFAHFFDCEGVLAKIFL